MKRVISAMLAICLIIGLLSVHASAEQVEGRLNEGIMTIAGDDTYVELEPNDDLMNSNLIEHGYTVYGTLSGEDLDVYIFEIGESCTVSVYTETTSDTLKFALFNCENGNLEWECNYFGIQPETGFHIVNMDAYDISPGIYCLIFWEDTYADAEYEFVVSMPGNLVCLHEYDDGVVTSVRTCLDDGITTFTCYRCGYQMEEVNPAVGHDFVGGKCTVCGVKPTDVIAEGLHDFGVAKWKVTQDGTLTISGKSILQNKTEYEWSDYAHLIKKVVIEDGVKRVPNNAFYQYPKLTQVVLGETITEIAKNAFAGCEKLTSINIPASVTKIQEYAFYGCSSLQEIQYPADSKLTTIEKCAFMNTGLLKVCFPASMTVIPEYAFAGCTNMEEIIVPEGIVKVDFHAFEGCTGAKTLSLPSTVTDIRNYAFDGCNNIEKFICNSTASFGKPYKNSLKIAEFGDQVTAVPGSAFDGCTKLEQVILTDKITSIGRDAFMGCTSLTSIDIPNSVTSISAWAFARSGLQKVTIPDSVTEMKNRVFAGSTNLSEVTLSKNISVVPNGTFDGCASLKQINLNPVTEIGFEAFRGCASLETVDLSNVEKIRYYAFQNCTALKQLTFSRNLKEIEFFAFWGCTALERIYFTGDAPTFGVDCFMNVTCDAYYPLGNSTWTEEVLQQYGGNVTWVGYMIGCTDHDCETVVIEPNCTEDGYTTGTCIVCGEVIVSDIVPALGHSWSEGSCDEPRTCTVCGEISGKDGHIYDDGVDGTCNICGIDRVTTKKRQVHHMLRMYNPNTGEHFYTGSEEERDMLVAAGWNYEGVAFTFPANTGAPVHRLFQPSTGEHLYTMDEEEKDRLLANGWNYEGVAFNSAYDTEAVQHRLYNPNATVGAYHFTFSEEEMQNLIDAGWWYQGIGWYSCWK